MNRNRIGRLSLLEIAVSSDLKAWKARTEKLADPAGVS